MKVFVTGATGVLGRPLVPLLIRAGHEVRAVCRRDDAAVALRDAGAEPVALDLFDPDAVRSAVEGSEAVLHLATNVPTLTKAGRPKGWDTHNRLRTVATEHLVTASRAAGVARFVKESVTFTYADGGDAWLTEESPLQPDLGWLTSTIDGEQAALGFAESEGAPTAVVLRFGLFYGGVGNRGTEEALTLARFGRSTVAGSRGAYLSSIHCDDVAAAVVAALGVGSGIYNVTDGNPLPRGEYLAAFAHAFGVKVPKPTPATLIRLGGGAATARALSASQRVSNAKFTSESGWFAQYSDAGMGWAAEARSRRSGDHQ